MIARLGQVLYWAACAVAVYIAGLGIAVWHGNSTRSWVGLIYPVGTSLLVWLAGRALLYILAGR